MDTSTTPVTTIMPKRNTQNWDVLWFMNYNGAITPLSAMANLGVHRLAARINDLKRMGWNINTTIKRVNRKSYASYSLSRPL